MLEIQITATNVRYSGGEVSAVHVSFQGRDPEQTINLSGYVPLTPEEYEGNESLTVLTGIIRNKLIERLQIPTEA